MKEYLFEFEADLKNLVNVRSAKIISAIDSALLFSVLAIIAGTPPVSEYEISIYNAYPWYFWLIISILLASPLIAIILGNITGKMQFFYLNLTTYYALISVIILLTLPAFRGYLFYGAGDTHSHLGLINDISFTGHFGIQNPYPGIHILLAILTNVLSCLPETTSLFITQIMFTLYIAFIFLLSRAFKCSRLESLSITSFAILPVIGSWITKEYIMPSTDAFFLIPLALFCIIQARLTDYKFPYSVLSVLLLILFPFMHVESTVFLFVAFIVFSFIFKGKNAYTPALILLIGCFVWFSSTLAFSGHMRGVYDALILGLVPATPPLQELMIKGVRVEILDAIIGFIQIYGPMSIYLGIGASASLFNLSKFIFMRNEASSKIYLSILLYIFIFINLIFLFKGTVTGFHIFRQTKYPLMISTFIIGLFFIWQLISRNRKIAYHCFLLLFVIAISVLIVYNIYPSPSTYTLNYQQTDSDIAGMNFFFSHRNNTFLILETIGRAYQTRWSSVINISTKSAIRWGYNEDVMPPNHFGYDRNGYVHLGDFYNHDQYLLIYPPCEIYYPTLYPNYPEFWDFSPNDFKLLNRDPTVHLVYSNYFLKVMLVQPTHQTKI